MPGNAPGGAATPENTAAAPARLSYTVPIMQAPPPALVPTADTDSLTALLPLLPAKQRATHPNDWMSTDAEVACPDPNCPSRFRITRMAKRVFRHSEVTAVPLPNEKA